MRHWIFYSDGDYVIVPALTTNAYCHTDPRVSVAFFTPFRWEKNLEPNPTAMKITIDYFVKRNCLNQGYWRPRPLFQRGSILTYSSALRNCISSYSCFVMKINFLISHSTIRTLKLTMFTTVLVICGKTISNLTSLTTKMDSFLFKWPMEYDTIALRNHLPGTLESRLPLFMTLYTQRVDKDAESKTGILVLISRALPYQNADNLKLDFSYEGNFLPKQVSVNSSTTSFGEKNCGWNRN